MQTRRPVSLGGSSFRSACHCASLRCSDSYHRTRQAERYVGCSLTARKRTAGLFHLHGSRYPLEIDARSPISSNGPSWPLFGPKTEVHASSPVGHSVTAYCGFFHFSTWAPCQDDGQNPAPGHRLDLPSSSAPATEEAECDLGPPASNAVVMAGIALLIFL
jgi:hypothetical protein